MVLDDSNVDSLNLTHDMKKLLARMLDQNGKKRPDFEEIVKILNINPKLRELEKFEEQISKNNQGCSNEGVMY